jgi:hypothetical protein
VVGELAEPPDLPLGEGGGGVVAYFYALRRGGVEIPEPGG